METQPKKSSEEIDLLYFFNPLIRGLRKLANEIAKYFYILNRKKYIFLAILIITISAGYFGKFIIPKSYVTKATFVSYNLPADFCSSMITSLHNLTRNKQNLPLLAKELNIPVDVAATIKSISAEPVDSTINFQFKDSSATAFDVYLNVRNIAGVGAIQEGMRQFLENNDYSVKRREVQKKTLQALRDSYVQDRLSLDSLKEIVNASIIPRTSAQGVILGEPINPVEVYQAQQHYYRLQLETEERLALLQNIEIIQPFFISNIPNDMLTRNLLFYSAVVGLLLALLLTPFIGRRI